MDRGWGIGYCLVARVRNVNSIMRAEEGTREPEPSEEVGAAVQYGVGILRH